MKSNNAVLIISIAILAISATAHAQAEPGLLAEIDSTSFIPSTITPGDVVSIAIDLHNKSSSIAINDLNATLETGNQFEGLQTQTTVNTILPDNTTTLVFRARVKDNTPSGHYSLTLNLNYLREERESEQREVITVPVSREIKNIDVIASPRVINPGKQTEIVFTLKNVGTSAVSNVSFSWSEANDLILPLGTDNKRYVPVVWPAQQAQVTYTAAADPNIAPGIYPLDITMNFTDTNGTRSEQSQVGIIIGGSTDFEVSAEMLATGQISLSVANIGSNNAQSLVVKVPKQPLLGVNNDYTEILGNLDKGDFTIATIETAAVQMPATSGTAVSGGAMPGGRLFQRAGSASQGNIQADLNNPLANVGQLSVQIDYTDTTGQRQSVTKSVALATQGSLTGSGQARQAGLPLLPIGIAIILIAIAITYNHFMAKKKWIEAGRAVIAVAALFAVAIFLFAGNVIATTIAAILSIGALWWVFIRKE